MAKPEPTTSNTVARHQLDSSVLCRIEGLRNSLGIITESELAEVLNLTPTTLVTWRGSGFGPAYAKLGKGVFYRHEDVYEWIKSNTRVPGGEGVQLEFDEADFDNKSTKAMSA